MGDDFGFEFWRGGTYLVDVVANDVLVVVNGGGCALEDTGLLGSLERRDIPNVCDWVFISGRATRVDFVGLVIEDDVLLPIFVQDLSLMSV